MQKFINHPWASLSIPIVFFLVLCAFRISVVDDFGMSWDEEVQRRHGIVSADYVNELCGNCFYDGYKEQVRLADYDHAHYGHWFPMLNYLFTDLQQKDAPVYREVYLKRHRIVSVFFFLCSIFFFLFCKKYLGHYLWGILGVLCFTFNPRIFAHSFYNPKDIILLGVFFLSMFTLLKCLNNKRVLWVALHGVVIGLLVSTRIVGVLMIPLTLIFMILYQKHKWTRWILFIIVAMISTVLFWPYLWEDPIGRFILSWQKMSQYPWEGTLLLDGVWYNSGETPWYYPLRWMMITIPLWILIPSFIGFINWGVTKIKRIQSKQWFTHWKEDLPFGLFSAGILPVVLLGSTLYDGWRQLFFVMIPIGLWALCGFQFLYELIKEKKWWKKSIAGGSLLLILLSFFSTSIYMVNNHPDYQVFFNSLSKGDHMKNYDLDYWGLSYSTAYKEIVDRIDDDVITISGSNVPAKLNAYFIPAEYRKRIRYVDDAWRARYFISNWRRDDFRERAIKNQWLFQEPVYILKAGNVPLVGVYKNPFYGIDPNKK